MFGRLKCTRAQMMAALRGRFTDHFRWELKHLLEQLDFLDRQVAEYEARIAASMDGHRDLLARPCTIPTVDLITAWMPRRRATPKNRRRLSRWRTVSYRSPIS